MKLMKFIDRYVTSGNQLKVIMPIKAGANEFEVEVMSDQGAKRWGEGYDSWLRNLDLDLDNVFGGRSGLVITTKAVEINPIEEGADNG